MARGSQAKTEFTEKLLSLFPDAFVDDKVIRVPWVENGEQLELKVALTCAKDVLGGAVSTVSTPASKPQEASAFDNPEPEKVQITENEAENVRKMLEALNLPF